MREIAVVAGCNDFRKARASDPDGLADTPIAVMRTAVEGVWMWF